MATDHIFEAAVRAYEFATNIDEPPSQHGLRAAILRALEIQREEIGQEIEAKTTEAVEVYGVYTDPTPAAKAAYAAAARTAREHGKEN